MPHAPLAARATEPTAFAHLRPALKSMELQKIGAVARLGLEDPEVVPLWFGESDLNTPQFIKDAAVEALAQNKTRYVSARGVSQLRDALRRYTHRVYDLELDPNRVTVCGSGMTAIMIAFQCCVNNGDNVVIPVPVWPNALHSVEVMGGEPRLVRLDDTAEGWQLDLDKLFDAVDERTAAIFLASPGNPTGWVMPADQQRAVLAFARERGIWVIADEVYHRLVFDGAKAAPSFLSIAEPEDPVLVVNTFSKSWAMTGWRLGWMVHPPSLVEVIGDLSAYNNTGATAFVQWAGIAALEQGEDFVRHMISYSRTGRQIVLDAVAGFDRIHLTPPDGAFYAFLRVDGMTDSLRFAQNLVLEHKVGFAPGAAFGPGNENYLRLCFACAPERLHLAFERLQRALG